MSAPSRSSKALAGLVLTLGLLLLHTAAPAALPGSYAPLVIEPQGAPARTEFDLSTALDRARRENKRLYVYLGAMDCPYCRRYENFLAKNAAELIPHFAGWLIVDLRSSLQVPASKLYIKVGGQSQTYAEFQRSIGDERARMLVYPSVWLFDGKDAARPRNLMQMPAGAGTFETVAEQLEILQLVQ
jgi:hypothetical protein